MVCFTCPIHRVPFGLDRPCLVDSVLIWEFQLAARLAILNPLRNAGRIPVALPPLATVGQLLIAYGKVFCPQSAVRAIELRLEAFLVADAEIAALFGGADFLND